MTACRDDADMATAPVLNTSALSPTMQTLAGTAACLFEAAGPTESCAFTTAVSAGEWPVPASGCTAYAGVVCCTDGVGEIRTHGTLSGSAVFKTAALNHSATTPSGRATLAPLP
jgi:hypothetical protein